MLGVSECKCISNLSIYVCPFASTHIDISKRDTYKHLHIYMYLAYIIMLGRFWNSKSTIIYTPSAKTSRKTSIHHCRNLTMKEDFGTIALERVSSASVQLLYGQKNIYTVSIMVKIFFLFRLNPTHMCRRISEMHLICIKSNNQLWPNISPSYTELFCFYICFEYILGCG